MINVKELYFKIKNINLQELDIAETIREHKIAVLAAALGVLMLLLLIAVLLFIHEVRSAPHQTKDISLDASVLQLPDEPLDLPPIHYSRKQKKIWTDADVQYWYTIPNEEQMQKLHAINEEKMKNLWETVP
ncbi:MAG: hypothetical protein ACTTJ7_07835 [Treponema sp.]